MIDYSVYPDFDDLPRELATIEDKAEYLSRICAAWDFGVPPTVETFALFAGWRHVFDQFPLRHSAAYAAFRTIFGWPTLHGCSVLEADYEQFDRREARQVPDPCSYSL